MDFAEKNREFKDEKGEGSIGKPTRWIFTNPVPNQVHYIAQASYLLNIFKQAQAAGGAVDYATQFYKGDKYRFDTSGDIDNVYITVESKKEPIKIKTTEVTVELVPIVELRTGASSDVAGFAAFNLGNGVGPETIGEPKGWGDLIGVTTDIGVADNKDVSFLNGEKTYREGKCHIKIQVDKDTIITVDELPRIDQGNCAYLYGTWLECSDDVWTYEDWYDGGTLYTYKLYDHAQCLADPGPPPEAMCGYTWVFDPTHGDATYDGWTDGYIYLFYSIGRPAVIPFVNWWPDEFNQEYEYVEQFNRTGWLMPDPSDYPNVDYSYFWDMTEQPGDMSDIGLYATNVTPYILRNSYFQFQRDTYTIQRLWGLLTNWGNGWIPLRDTGRTSFPYTSPVNVPLREDTIKTEHARIWLSSGVYPETEALDFAYREFYIQGGYRMDQGRYEYGEGWVMYKRVVVDVDTEFSNPENLTERQLVLCEGNEDVMDWPEPDYWTGLSSLGEFWYERTACIATMLVAGDDYYIFTPQVIDNDYDYGTEKGHDQYYEECDVYDYGIFNSTMERDIKNKFDPVYVYAFVANESDPYRLSFGVIYNKLHYRSLWFEQRGPGYYVPGIEGYTKNGEQLLALPQIRMGLKTTTTISEREIEE